MDLRAAGHWRLADPCAEPSFEAADDPGGRKLLVLDVGSRAALAAEGFLAAEPDQKSRS